MSTKDSAYSLEWQEAVMRELSLEFARADTQIVPIIRPSAFALHDGADSFPAKHFPQLKSELRVTRWLTKPNVRQSTARADTVVFYQLLWAPYRDVIKGGLLACFESLRADDPCPPNTLSGELKNDDPRALLNALLKDRVLISGLPDAAIVMSGVADYLRSDLDQAMCLIAKDALGDPLATPCRVLDSAEVKPTEVARQSAQLRQTLSPTFVVVTHSLGSFLIADGQRRALTRQSIIEKLERSAYHALDTATVFMMANQLSLLELARLSARCTKIVVAVCENDDPNLKILHDSSRTAYVAFNDRNDLLDFELQPSLRDLHDLGTVVNVSVRNRCPVLLQVIKEPGCAHGEYIRNPAVVKAIVKGIELPRATEGASGKSGQPLNGLATIWESRTFRVGLVPARRFLSFLEVATVLHSRPPNRFGFLVPSEVGIRVDSYAATDGDLTTANAFASSLTVGWLRGLIALRQRVHLPRNGSTTWVPQYPVLVLTVLSFIDPAEGFRLLPGLRVEQSLTHTRLSAYWQLR